MLLVFVWCFLCVAAGLFASIRRNRNGFGWFLIAFFFSPLVAFVLLAILMPREDKPQEEHAKVVARRAPGF